MSIDGIAGIDIDCSFGGDNFVPEISIWSRFIDLDMIDTRGGKPCQSKR
jgi:hypothetical protein